MNVDNKIIVIQENDSVSFCQWLWHKGYVKQTIAFIIIMLIIGDLLYPVQVTATKGKSSKVTIYIGQNYSLQRKGVVGKIRWQSLGKKVAVVSKKGKVTGRKAGKATIIARTANEKYIYQVVVKRPQLNYKEKILREGQSFLLKMKGASVEEWTTSDESILEVNQKGKVTAKQVGTGIITCRTKEERFYSCMITVKKSKKHVHEYFSEITIVPTCCNEGVESFVCSCGDSYSRNIPASGLHQYGSIVTPPRCTTYGYTTYFCRDCGYSYQSDFLRPLGHDTQEQVIHEVDEAHCMEYDKTYDVCKNCGDMYFLGGTGVEKHDFASVVIPPTETEPGYTMHTCNNCGKEVKEELN